MSFGGSPAKDICSLIQLVRARTSGVPRRARHFRLLSRRPLDGPDHRSPGIGHLARIFSVAGAQLDPAQAGAVRIALPCTGALPDIRSDMMVIAARGEENRRRPIFRHRVETEGFVPEALRFDGIP